MKEKRRRRQNRQQQQVILRGPPLNLTRPAVPESSSTLETTDDGVQRRRAQELLDAQRDSVKALTEMRENLVRHLNVTTVHRQLQEVGYAVVDDFLESSELITAMQDEAMALYKEDANVTRDLSNLGCSNVPLQGGSQQYAIAPRCIEWVVALTKHGAGVLGHEEDIDNGRSEGQMRVFDQNARKAALELLYVDEDVDDSRSAVDFTTIVEDKQNDVRRLSVIFFLVDSDWENGGGGYRFQDGTEFPAKRNRLVVVNATDTNIIQDTWRGTEHQKFGSSIVVHLIQKQGN